MASTIEGTTDGNRGEERKRFWFIVIKTEARYLTKDVQKSGEDGRTNHEKTCQQAEQQLMIFL